MIAQFIKPIERLLKNHKIDVFGKDSMVMSTLPYYFLVFFTILGMYIALRLQSPTWVIFLIYGFIPMLDEIFNHDWRNPQDNQSKQLLQENWKFEIPLYFTVLIDWICFFIAMNQFKNIEINFTTLPIVIGTTIIYSNLNAAQFSVAHEILHKGGWRRVIGTLHMAKTLNIHFTYQHIYGHHRRVATPQDPASAKKGQNVYRFFINSYFGAYKSVYNLDKVEGTPPYMNKAVLSVIFSILFTSGVYYFYQLQATIIFLICMVGSVFYLEVINFVEHYGLRRKKLENGQYQKVSIIHSWNAPHRFSNYLFFKLQRHSDHHANSLKPFQTLVSFEQSPQLPHGYIVMTIMALFPSIWFRIMDPIVDSYNKDQRCVTQVISAKGVDQTRRFVIQLFLATFIAGIVSSISL